MKNAIAITIVILFILSGCGENKQSSKEFITVDVTASYPKKELILQDIMDVEYIPLETSDEFLTSAFIHAIGKDVMIFTDELWGSSKEDIFIFDRNGKGLRKINRRGQGGEEYVNAQDVVLDEDNNEIYVNSTFSKKVLVYDLLGNFKRSFFYGSNFTLTQMRNFNQDYLICHDAYFRIENELLKDEKRNCFLLISKQNGDIKEIPIPYEDKKSMIVFARDANGKIINDRGIRNRVLIPQQDAWILTEVSADTIYSYSPDHSMKPFIVRTPSVQSMDPEVFLFPGVVTDRYCFMQTVKREFNFVANEGFPMTDLIYDRQESAIFECTIYNNDFTNKTPANLVYEYPWYRYTFGNNEIAFIKRLEAFELVEAYEKGQLKDGKLKEIAATLDEEDNAVIMLVKHKK